MTGLSLHQETLVRFAFCVMKLWLVSEVHTSKLYFYQNPESVITRDITSKTRYDRRLDALH